MRKGFQIALVAWLLVGGFAAFGEESTIDFESQVEPILREHCLDCHGPDKQKGAFRVDRLASLLAGGDSGEAAVVPGEAAASFLVKAIRHKEPDYEMPPKGDPLSEAGIALIETWIDEGAKTPERYGPSKEQADLTHWSFVPVRRSSAADGIDGFIERKLAENGLEPSPEADRRTLIRRLYLVMLGLPPTPAEVEKFVTDSRPDAWSRLVEGVLASPHYGERWATHWLDLVRFGETHGFETNRERPGAWPYRDWVIAAFNDDKPYDQFVRAQIAGDSLGDEIGTAFLVAGPFDAVKGQDPKLRQMQRMNELDDMINTTGTAFLGLTTGCARCHNHKFDPISQTDYYAMQAVFAGVQHGDRQLPLPAESRARAEVLDREVTDLTGKLRKFLPRTSEAIIAIDDADAELLTDPKGTAEKLEASSPDLSRGSYTWWSNRPGEDVARYSPGLRGPYRVWLSWGAGFSSHSADARYLLETSGGRREIANVNQQLAADGGGKPDQRMRWSGLFDAGVHEFEPGDAIVLRGGETGSAVTGDVILFQPVDEKREKDMRTPSYRAPVNARRNVETFPAREARFVRFTIEETNRSLPCLDELEIYAGDENVALAGRGAKATSSGDFVHPKHKLAHINDGRHGNDHSWIAREASGGWVQIELPETVAIERIEWGRDREGTYDDRLPVRYRIEVATREGAWERVAGSSDRWPVGETRDPGGDYRFTEYPEAEALEGRRWLARLEAARKERAALEESNRVYAGKFQQPGPTHRLYRGEPEMKREEVGPDAIEVFGSLELDKDAPEKERRLAFADWVADPENPLTARVIVNRIWQFHFGTGIVDTPSDFGRNGTAPTHPELLDWLASELVENGWSLKHIHRLILASATWRQSHFPRREAMTVDAASRLLWRFPPRRLEAEGIRDSILRVSGSLELASFGGPGFSPFEVEQENVRHYHPKESFGPADWRRMIYMTKVRQEREQVFGAFDCPDASQAVPKRSRSTTPLQALNLLNSSFVIQQAKHFAARLAGDEKDRVGRIQRAWELCYGRPATESEVADAANFIEAEGWVPFCRAMLNTNEFVFIP